MRSRSRAERHGARRALASLVLAGLALIACGSPAPEPPPPTYADVQRIFDARCGGTICHETTTRAAAGGLDLAPAVSYRQLVGRPSSTAPGRVLVVAGEPGQSYLVCKLDPACRARVGALMPTTGPLSAADLDTVRRWIALGALPDGDPPPPIDAGDDAAPTFAGLTSATATGEHQLTLRWEAATDQTPADRLRYRIYVATQAGGQDFTAPERTVTGVTTATVDGLATGVRYHVVVRAVDELDHEDTNRVERDAVTPDLTPPEFGGVLALAEPTPGTLEVRWTAATDNLTAPAALRYRVFVATTPGGQDFAAPTATAVGVSDATITGLAPSTTLHVVVRAVDEAGNVDGNLLERSLTTADTVAPTFAGVTTATAAPSAVVLTWAAATDDATPAAELVYLVYRATVAGGQDFTTPSYVTPPGVTTFSAGGLAANRTYHFVVRARDRAGNVDGNVSQRSATTPVLVDVQAPTFAGITSATSVGASSLQLDWSAAADNVTLPGNLVYRVYRATAAGGQTFAAATYVTPPGATSFVATGLAPSTPYFFVVRAVDQAGNVDANVVERSATTTADVTAPTFAGITGAVGMSSSTIALAWNPATDDITGAAAMVYDVYRATAAGGQSFAAPSYTTGPGATGLVATGLAPATTYFFVVRARDQAGNRDGNTSERSGTTSADVTPPTFAGVATVAATGVPGQLDVTWPAASDLVTPAAQLQYLVFAATTSGFQTFPSPTAVSAPGATSLRVTGLVAGATYFVVVRARDAAGNVDTNTVEVSAATTPDTIAPTFAGVTTATALGPARVQLTWAAGTDDVTAPAQLVYDVYAATSAGGQGFGAPTATSQPGATSILVGGLSPSTTHHFVVRARDQGGNRDGNTVERSAATPAFTVRFATQVQPILAASCATVNCHRPPFPAVGLDLSTAASSHAQMVDVPSAQFVLIPRVAPGDPGGSYLMAKLAGGGPSFEGAIMPPSGALPPASIALIQTWIAEGAADN